MAEKIDLEQITSTNLRALGYNGPKQILAIQFKNGDIYHYAGVPADVAQQLYLAESRGRFYGQQIRGKYTGQKMTGHCPDCGAGGWVGDRCDDCGCSNFAEDPRRDKPAQTVEQLAPIDARD